MDQDYKPSFNFRWVFQVCLVWIILAVSTSLAFADRIKDLASVAGVRSNQLVGYGVVVGLAGTGDGTSALTVKLGFARVFIWATSSAPIRSAPRVQGLRARGPSWAR